MWGREESGKMERRDSRCRRCSRREFYILIKRSRRRKKGEKFSND
jgi:hypothetical protein